MPSRKKDRALWRKIFLQWDKSGQTGSSFCRDRDIPYSAFIYWKSKLRPKVETVAFEELKEPPTAAPIELRWGEVSLFLPLDFDMESLQRCLGVLRRIQCSQ